MLGMSQQALARSLGITFQQLQKNERGANRIGSSRLFDLSLALNVPVQYFFDEMPREIANTALRPLPSRSTDSGSNASETANLVARRETLELVRAYYRIKDRSVRRHVCQLANSLGTGDTE